MFISTLPDIGLDSERNPIPNAKSSYQEVFTRDLVRELVLAYHHGNSIVKIREKLDDSMPWELRDAKLPASRINFVSASNSGSEIGEGNVLKESDDKQIHYRLVPDESLGNHEEYDSYVTASEEVETVEVNIFGSSVEMSTKIPWANTQLATWILQNAQSIEDTNEDEAWVSEIVNKLRMALISYNLQAKLIGHRLTPNSIVIRLKGSDQLKVDDIEKKRSPLLTTHALDVINIMAQPGEIVVSLARSQRQSISLADVWKVRKVQSNASGLNMSFVIGVKEIDGELLYLNLGGEFEGGAQHAPHTLIAGATGSGKSVLLQNLILDICVTNSKELAHIYLIDPKYGVDYMNLEELPHLVEGIIDGQEKAIQILEDLVVEMNDRYQKFRGTKVNNLKDYNVKVSESEKLPLIFLIHDEFAEWMLVDEYKSAVSSIVQRLGVKARAAGIHLIFAAQRPDANVLPVQLRDNLGNRLILRVESVGTSEISLGEKGAEKLLGKGHLAARLQGEQGLIFGQVPFLSSEKFSEVSKLIN